MNNVVQVPKNNLKAFFEGVASAFNLNGDAFELPEVHTDAENILSDWQTVGNYMRVASKQMVDENEKK